MKKRQLLICVLLLALAALVAGACGGQKNAEEIARENGATVKVTIDLASGISDNRTERYLLIHEGAPLALPWAAQGGAGIISSPYREGYRYVGIFHGTKDEEGNITYGAEWDPRERFSEDTTLYVKWAFPYIYRVVDPADPSTSLKDFSVAVGDTLDTSDRSAPQKDGYTFIGYYSDAALTEAWDETYEHPGTLNGVDPNDAAPDDFIVTVYAKFVEGEYKKVYKASDFTTAQNYWLIGDENGVIDFTGWNRFPLRRQFVGTIEGNGVTLKNLTVSWDQSVLSQYENVGLFGKLDGATIRNVKFENCKLEIGYTETIKGNAVIKIGFFAGAAENATVENVSFENCELDISVKMTVDSEGEDVPIVLVVYEGSDLADGVLPEELPIWQGRERDGADDANNSVTNVSGSLVVNYNEIHS